VERERFGFLLELDQFKRVGSTRCGAGTPVRRLLYEVKTALVRNELCCHHVMNCDHVVYSVDDGIALRDVMGR
jgi:hypothetical protein